MDESGSSYIMEQKAVTFLKLGILFLCVNIKIGRWDILPDFAGVLLLAASIECHAMRTEAEEKIRMLFLLLSADLFLHWIVDFENRLEGMLFTAVYCYAMFVLLEEAAERIRSLQPYRANLMKAAGTGLVLLHTTLYIASVYGYEFCYQWLNVFLLMVLVMLFTAVWGIRK